MKSGKPSSRKETPKQSSHNSNIQSASQIHSGSNNHNQQHHQQSTQMSVSSSSRIKKSLSAFPIDPRSDTNISEINTSQNNAEPRYPQNQQHLSHMSNSTVTTAAAAGTTNQNHRQTYSSQSTAKHHAFSVEAAQETPHNNKYTALYSERLPAGTNPPTNAMIANTPANAGTSIYSDQSQSQSRSQQLHHSSSVSRFFESQSQLQQQQQQHSQFHHQINMNQSNNAFSLVENLIHKRGWQNEKYVPMELFAESMQHFERRLETIESRIEDTESMVQLNERLFDLRHLPAIASKRREPGSINQSQEQQFEISNSSSQNSSAKLARPASSSQHVVAAAASSSNQQTNTQVHSAEDLQSRLDLVDRRISQFEEFTKHVISDVEKKFVDYGKKLNVQIEKFFKNANDKDLRLVVLTDNIEKQIDIFKQTFLLKEEELSINKDDFSANFKTLSALLGKLENRINEHSIDITDSRTLIKNIEDDLFTMLHTQKDLSDKVLKYRNIYDEVAFLKLNQTNILKHANLPTLHTFQNV